MKRKAKPACIVFNEDSRKEFVTGFHKRKIARRKKFHEKLERDLKEAKKRIKAEARDTLKKIVSSYEQTHHVPAIFEKEYELPEHIVSVRELLAEDIAKENNWIGQNRCSYQNQSHDELRKLEVNDGDDGPGTSLNSIKAIKKAVSKRSIAIMQQDKIFKKKNNIERVKNKKKANMKKRLLEKKKGKMNKERR